MHVMTVKQAFCPAEDRGIFLLTEQLAAPTPENLLDEIVKQNLLHGVVQGIHHKRRWKKEIYWKAAQKQIPGCGKGVEGKPRWEDKWKT